MPCEHHGDRHTVLPNVLFRFNFLEMISNLDWMQIAGGIGCGLLLGWILRNGVRQRIFGGAVAASTVCYYIIAHFQR